MSKYVIRKTELSLGLEEKTHPLNPTAKRRARSLGDGPGLTRIGIHYTVLEPGDISTEKHAHRLADEFIYILEGKGTLALDEENVEVESGDFIALPARGPAHSLKNTGRESLIYLVGGDRPDFDVCHYPNLQKRLYLYENGDRRTRDFVHDEAVESK